MTDDELYAFTQLHEDTLMHLNRVFYMDMDQCGCGNPEDTWALVRDVLALAPFFEDGHAKQVSDLLGRAHNMVLNLLTHADLLEHGGSVGGSWLTGKGEWVRWAIGQVGLDNVDFGVDEVGLPHDGEACTAECWQIPAVVAPSPVTA